MCICIYAHMRMHTVCTYKNTYIYIHVCVCVCVCVCLSVCLCVCLRVSVCVSLSLYTLHCARQEGACKTEKLPLAMTEVVYTHVRVKCIR